MCIRDSLYLIFSVYTYLKREKIQFYEVVDGGIVNNRTYNGLILREEQVKTADRSGYINYYLREGKRASVGSRIYSLDETGNPVSYTHLDVYKRQSLYCPSCQQRPICF